MIATCCGTDGEGRRRVDSTRLTSDLGRLVCSDGTPTSSHFEANADRTTIGFRHEAMTKTRAAEKLLRKTKTSSTMYLGKPRYVATSVGMIDMNLVCPPRKRDKSTHFITSIQSTNLSDQNLSQSPHNQHANDLQSDHPVRREYLYHHRIPNGNIRATNQCSRAFTNRSGAQRPGRDCKRTAC